jgi:hypothetical protein
MGASTSSFPLFLLMKNNTLIVLIIELVLVKNYGVEILETRCPMNELVGQQ